PRGAGGTGDPPRRRLGGRSEGRGRGVGLPARRGGGAARSPGGPEGGRVAGLAEPRLRRGPVGGTPPPGLAGAGRLGSARPPGGPLHRPHGPRPPPLRGAAAGARGWAPSRWRPRAGRRARPRGGVRRGAGGAGRYPAAVGGGGAGPGERERREWVFPL